MIQAAPPVRAPLTQRQSDILDFIVQFIDEHRYSPSYRDLCARFRVRINAIRGHLIALRRKGYIEFEAHRSRTIRVTEVADTWPTDLDVLAMVAWSCTHRPLQHFDEVADQLGGDRTTVASQLERLRSQGFVTWDADTFTFRLLCPIPRHQARGESR